MRYIQVVNLERYQHYKNRNPPWVKWYTHCLDDSEFAELDDATKWLAVGLVMLASRCSNRIKSDSKWIQNRLGMHSEPNLKALRRTGFLASIPRAKRLLRDRDREETETETENVLAKEGKEKPQRKPTPTPDDTSRSMKIRRILTQRYPESRANEEWTRLMHQYGGNTDVILSAIGGLDA